MASLSSLLSGGSFTLLPGGGFSFSVTTKTKFKWGLPHVKRKLDDANRKALMRAGSDVRIATRKGMSNRAPMRTPRLWNIATRAGYQLVARIRQVPRQDRVTSWKTSRSPKGYLRSQIQYDYDPSSRSVVIGPESGGRDTRVHYLLEKGGMATFYFVPSGKQFRSGSRVYGHLTNRRPRISGTRIEQAGLFRFTRTIAPRRFMSRGLEAAREKIPQAFRNSLSVS